MEVLKRSSMCVFRGFYKENNDVKANFSGEVVLDWISEITWFVYSKCIIFNNLTTFFDLISTYFCLSKAAW